MDGETLAEALGELQSIGPDATEARLRIFSGGGDAIATLLFIELVRDWKAERGLHIICVGSGMVASAAAIVFESRVCDERLLEPATVLLSITPASTAEGSLGSG
jgi:ATP-dependent protease ClpP protease subunit